MRSASLLPLEGVGERALGVTQQERTAVRADARRADAAQVGEQRTLLRQAQLLATADRAAAGQRDTDHAEPVVALLGGLLRQCFGEAGRAGARARHVWDRANQE